MISVKLDDKTGIAILYPDGPLTRHDFVSAAEVIDPYIEKTGQLNGLIICTETFPGWESFEALFKHLKFVKEHHKKVSHIALVTNSKLAGFAEKVAGHFISIKFKHFDFDNLHKAKSWIVSSQAG